MTSMKIVMGTNLTERRAQASLEFIIVLTLGLTLLAGGLLYYNSQASQITFASQSQSMISAGTIMTSTIDDMALLGRGSKTSILLNLPTGIRDISQLHYNPQNLSTNFVFTLSSIGGESSFLFSTQYPFRMGNCSSYTPFSEDVIQGGSVRFDVESCGSFVAISER